MIERQGLNGKPVKLPKPCTYCKGLGHLAFGCTKKPRKPLHAKKPMKKIGRVGRKLIDQRTQYFVDNPGPDYYCYYCLFIGVEEPLTKQQVQLEHFLTKNNRQDLRFNLSNIVLACPGHNEDKAGQDGPAYLEKLRKRG